MGVVWAMTLPGLVCSLIALAFAEVAVFEQRQHTLMHRDEETEAAPPLLAFDSVANRITFSPVTVDRDTGPE